VPSHDCGSFSIASRARARLEPIGQIIWKVELNRATPTFTAGSTSSR